MLVLISDFYLYIFWVRDGRGRAAFIIRLIGLKDVEKILTHLTSSPA